MKDDGGGERKTPLWRFVLSLYESPAVAEACVRLQDAADLNAAFALACLWLGREGISPASAQKRLERAYGATETFHDGVLGAVRAARRRMKPLIDGMPGPMREHAGDLRKEIAKVELGLEELEYALIHDSLKHLPRHGEGDARKAFAAYLQPAGLTLNREVEGAFDELVRTWG
jgi:uncharacterized protein (TIGR02444 family)